MHEHGEHIKDNKEHGHSHTHGSDGHGHSHTHDPEVIRRIINRLSRSMGHLAAVKRMVEEGRDCADVLIQLSAVEAELNSTGRALLKEHMEHCIVDAIKQNDTASIEKMNAVIDKLLK